MASRKRNNAELAEFKQKVSRENADIIKIKQLRQQIDDARAGARARFDLLKQKCRERRQKLEEIRAVVAERQRELELKSGTAARLMADLAAEARARYRAESALRAKDDELAQQTALILELRADKERQQENIAELQATMENVHKALTGPARPQVQTPAERDADDLWFGFLSDGAVDSDALEERHAEPIAELQATMENVGNELTGPARPQVQAPAGRDADDRLFSFFSDDSEDSDALDERHAEPIAELQATMENVGNELTGPARPQVQAPAGRDADDRLFSFFSDDSEDSDALDERHAEPIAELQATMENVGNELTGPARPQVQAPAGRDADDRLFSFFSDDSEDSDALDERHAEPIAELQATMENVGNELTGPARPQVQAPAGRDADDRLFSFFSDDSEDSDALDERHAEPIAELQATMENVGNELTGPARPQVQAPAGRDADDRLFSFFSDDSEDSDALDERHAEPIAELQATMENVGNELTGPARPQVQAPAGRDADDRLFSFFSDDSEDSDALDMIPKDRPTGRQLEIIHPVIRLSFPDAVQNNAVPKSSVKKNVVPNNLIPDNVPENEDQDNGVTILDVPELYVDKEDLLLVKNVVPVDVVANSQPEHQKTAHVDTIAEDNVQEDIVLPSTSADKTARVDAEDGQTDNIPALTSANKASKKELKVVLERVTEGTPKSSAKKGNKTNETIKIHVTKCIIKQPNSIIETPIKKKMRFSDIIEENVTNPTIQIGLPPKKPKPFTCDICKKCFNIKDTLRIHIRSYHSQTGKKKFPCDMCDKGFHHKAQYEMHYRLHTGVKPYQCKVCQKKIHRKDCYDRHTITHTDTKPHQCNKCGKRFYVRYNLVQHIRTHTGEKPHQCNVCGKKFSARITLHMHNRIHTDEKPYRCDICKRYFYNSERLINHFRSHSDSDPLKCMDCRKNFIVLENYLKHVAKHEKEKRTESVTVIKNNKSKINIKDNDKKSKDNKNNQIKDNNKIIKSIKNNFSQSEATVKINAKPKLAFNDIDKENFSRKRTRSSHTQDNGHVVAQQAKRRRNI